MAEEYWVANISGWFLIAVFFFILLCYVVAEVPELFDACIRKLRPRPRCKSLLLAARLSRLSELAVAHGRQFDSWWRQGGAGGPRDSVDDWRRSAAAAADTKRRTDERRSSAASSWRTAAAGHVPTNSAGRSDVPEPANADRGTDDPPADADGRPVERPAAAAAHATGRPTDASSNANRRPAAVQLSAHPGRRPDDVDDAPENSDGRRRRTASGIDRVDEAAVRQRRRRGGGAATDARHAGVESSNAVRRWRWSTLPAVVVVVRLHDRRQCAWL